MKTKRFAEDIFLILLFCSLSLYADIVVNTDKPHTAVNDYARILSEQTRTSLEQLCISVNEKTGVALVLAIYQSLEGSDIDEAANKIYERWGIGAKGKDEGVLVLIAMQERKIRIETGYGVEGYITDLTASQIRQKATTEYLSKNQWDKGLTLIFYSLAQLIANEKGVSFEELIPNDQQLVPIENNEQINTFSPLKILFIFIIILLLLGTRTGRAVLPWLLLSSMSGSRRSHFGGGGFGGGFGGGDSEDLAAV